ncbi:response regulator transcription factor [Dethiosulfovibrio salsuginis]|uniref:Two component transcriptional regulator, winged helix family n=1 Tax=Dethiosulfovibrio salsuginis TaxID=561720 RepID=A0A1X7L569_9BACT|nr:response regulator transcription factor [Dethiosulfovibrio salsuginis]SMG48875.1 two component transcriptional regulator, winged helix family [Dethiosulfovibrio salsuginis]
MDRILVVDDDKELAELLCEYLTGEGFKVDIRHDGKSGSSEALSERFDLVVLDVMLPGQNGFDVLKEIRKTSSVPVVMLTAKGDEVDRVLGLEMGADDYLPKPFSPRELLARIRAVLRRQGGQGDKERLAVGDLEMVVPSRQVFLEGISIEMTAMEFRLLETLLRSVGRVISRDELFSKVLERSSSPFDRSLDMHISNLRKKLGAHRDGSDRIRTIRGEGYLYAAPVE